MSHEESQPPSNNVPASEILREVHGRVLNSTNEMYMLPADASEHKRLDCQSQSLFLALGSRLYHQETEGFVLRALKKPEGSEIPLILDLGTGSGKWAVDMAHQFPHCQVIGLDIVPVTSGSREIPSNCRFEIGDANFPFERFHDKISVVHARSMNAGIKDQRKFLDEIARMLVPGGVFLRGDGDPQLYSESFAPLPECNPGDPGFSWVQKVLFTSRNVLQSRGTNIPSSAQAPKLIASIPDFVNLGSESVYVPIGQWVKDDNIALQESGKLMAADVLMLPRAMRPLILSGGVPEETIDTMIKNAEAEVREQKLHLYSIWHYAWATKVASS